MSATGKGLGWFKRLMIDHPQLAFGTAHYIVGVGAAAYYLLYKYDPKAIGYLPGYVVMRPDDPRVPHLRKFPYNP